MATVVGSINQKGGCGKTTLTVCLGGCLARMGYRVCVIDCDPQANATMALGYRHPDTLPITLPHIMETIIKNGGRVEGIELLRQGGYILQSHGLHLVPSSIYLSELENVLTHTISRETILKKFVDLLRPNYDVILLDGMPSLNVITVCTLNVCDKVLIPTQPQFFSVKGIEMLLSTIANVRNNLNPNLRLWGAVVTMFDNRINFHNEVLNTLITSYGNYLKVFNTKIPISVRVTESQAQGLSLYDYDPTCKVTAAYEALTRELITNG